MQCHVVTLKWTDISEVRIASNIKAMMIHHPDDGGSTHL
jgi:hypothetical protein